MSSDREAIYEVINRYLVAVDRRDADLLRSCFTDDVEASYEGRALERGPQAVVDFVFGGAVATATFSVEDVRVRRHYLSTTAIELDGHTADVESYVVVRIVDAPADGYRMRTRGVRYVDTFTKRDGQWLIASRHHHVDWMREHRDVVAVADAPEGERS